MQCAVEAHIVIKTIEPLGAIIDQA